MFRNLARRLAPAEGRGRGELNNNAKYAILLEC